MIDDYTIEQLFKLLTKGKSLTQAAKEANISYKTALKYKRIGRLPSQIRAADKPHIQRLFDDRWEKDVVPYMIEYPGSSASRLLNHLIEMYPKKYALNQLRTLQRRLKNWKDSLHPWEEVESIYSGTPGELGVTGILSPPLEIFIRGELYHHELLFFLLPFSGWMWLNPIVSKENVSIVEHLEEIFWRCKFSPRSHYHWYTPAHGNTVRDHYEQFQGCSEFYKHYGIKPVRSSTAIPPKWNSVKSKMSYHFKEYFKDVLKKGSLPGTTEYLHHIIKLNNHINDDISDEAIMWEMKEGLPLPKTDLDKSSTNQTSDPPV